MAFVLIVTVLGVGVGRQLHEFLAMNKRVTGGVLVVEGWAPDYTLQQVMAEFKGGPREKVFVTGGPIEWGALLSEHKTYAERGAAILLKMGMPENVVQPVPAPRVQQDRTYACARALRQWSREHNFPLRKVQVVTEGPHARRSRLLFAKALGRDVEVGVTAVPILDYDPDKWWRSSAGVRGVIGELLAYCYARLFFWSDGS